jgi:deazaflavin-dependent oxidoreductase (nitroreductase family)
MTLFGDQHVRKYQETDGAEGYHWRNGTTILLLTTTGRKSGTDRTSALIYRDWEDKQLIVASKGGADEPPAWFLNLDANPEVQVQIKGEKFAARARTASADEKPAMWEHMVQVWPDYANYQAKTDRDIPVVVLERAS